MSSLRVQTFAGSEIATYLTELAALRCEVFHEYPYLYKAQQSNEERYLADYSAQPQSFFVMVFDDTQLVGCASSKSLAGATEPILQDAILRGGYDQSELFLYGESVLHKGYRSQGIGHVFFQEREDYGRAQGFRYACFFAVERPQNHPQRPTNYQDLDLFWQSKGFRKTSVNFYLAYQEYGATIETPKLFSFWIKKL